MGLLQKRYKIAQSNEDYEYATTQLRFNEETVKDIRDWVASNIETDDLIEKGLEDEIHVTVLYGIKEDIPDEQLSKLVTDSGLKTVDFVGLGSFGNDSDVLFIRIHLSGELMHLVSSVRELYPDNANSHPDYIPHLTLAYLKKGTADKYIEKYRDVFYQKAVPVSEVEFVSSKRKITKYKTAAVAEDIFIVMSKYKKRLQEAAATYSQESFYGELESIFKDLAQSLGLRSIHLERNSYKQKELIGNGGIVAKINTAYIQIDASKKRSILGFAGWNQFMDELEEILSHEIQHKVDDLLGYGFTDQQYSRARSQGRYLDIPDEISAYAIETISQLRNIGYTDIDIVHALDNHKYKELASDSRVFNMYMSEANPDLVVEFVDEILHKLRSHYVPKKSSDEQEYSSAGTSINQLPMLFKKVN